MRKWKKSFMFVSILPEIHLQGKMKTEIDNFEPLYQYVGLHVGHTFCKNLNKIKWKLIKKSSI